MPKFLLLVNYDGGLPETPMRSWGPADIKARLSAVPGPGGIPTQQPIEVRQVIDGQAPDL